MKDRLRLLVTGGAGFIGTNLVQSLAARPDFEVVVIDDLSVGQPEGERLAPVRFLKGDFRDPRLLAEGLAGADAVVHLAALSGVVDSVADPRPSFEVNVQGSLALLEAARAAGVAHVVVASTGGALAGDAPPPISEATPPGPLSPYGASKLAMEGYCSAFAGAYGMACATLRFSNIYGPGSPHKRSAVAAFIKNCLRGEPLTVFGDGEQRRDYLYVGDLADAIETVLRRRVTGVYQLGSGRPTSLNELIAALQTVVRRPLEVERRPPRPGEVRDTWCDIGKAATDFGFAAPTALAEGLQRTWTWFLDHWPSIRHIAAIADD